MSYHGTVTCSHCYERGHNKRSCPDLTERYRRYFENAKRTGNQYHMDEYAKELKKRTGIDPLTGEPIKKQRGRCLESMQCSYCKYNGHTRRTCSHLKEDKQVFIRVTQRNRAQIVEEIETRGLGVGTLIPYTYRGYNRATGNYGSVNAPRFVVGYNWNKIKDSQPEHITAHDFIKAVDIRTLGSDGTSNHFSLDYLDRLTSSETPLQLSRSCDIRERVPAGWLEARDLNFENKFTSGDSRDGRYGYWKKDHPEIIEARIALGFDQPETEE